jgi:hypothetical protein
MPAWKPIKRREFIRLLCALDFDGPYRGTRHEFLVYQEHRQTISQQTRRTLNATLRLISDGRFEISDRTYAVDRRLAGRTLNIKL